MIPDRADDFDPTDANAAMKAFEEVQRLRALLSSTPSDSASHHDIMTCRKPICVGTARMIRERRR